MIWQRRNPACSAILAFSVAVGLGFTAPARADAGTWLDRSHRVFLPRALSEELGSQQRFPVFWWNFLVLEEDAGLVEGRRACALFSSPDGRKWVAKSGCHGLGQFAGAINDWARDLPLREAVPTAAVFSQAMSDRLAEASLPLDPEMLGILRRDPFASYRELERKARQGLQLHLREEGGFYVEPDTHRLVVPVQFTFPPSDTRKTREFLKHLGGNWALIGPHGSSLGNESQVMRDVHVVSRVGLALLALLALVAAVSGRGRLAQLLPPVFIATGIGIAATILTFGSIHGLTLSFGTGIVGLALDYGLLSAFNPGSHRAWKANLFGLLTTLAGLLLMMGSSIPLLRQLMFFSAVGLTAAFILFFVMHHYLPQIGYAVRPIEVSVKPSALKASVVGALVVSALGGFLVLRPNLDLEAFNFQDARTAKLGRWIFSKIETRSPLIQLTPPGTDALAEASTQKKWADSLEIPFVSLASFVPDRATQAIHLSTWRSTFCPQPSLRFDEERSRFFAPFLKGLSCAALTPVLLSEQKIPAYVADFESDGQWATLWLPRNDGQARQIQTRFPAAFSLREVASLFPATISRELSWMAPWSFVLAALLLAFYYRRLAPTLVALVPFFSGMGAVALGQWAFGLGFSFVSIIGLVLVFGFSFDYGIFATQIRPQTDPRAASAIWSALSLAALATGGGFAPLLFCRHPVLRDLGQTLFLGVIGTYLGAIWGVPFLMGKLNKLRGETT